MTKLTLDHEERALVTQALNRLSGQLHHVWQQLQSQVYSWAPEPQLLVASKHSCQQLAQMIGNVPTQSRVAFELDEPALVMVRTALSNDRRQHADNVQRSQTLLNSAELSSALAKSVAPLDALLSTEALRGIVPNRPRLADFLSSFGRDQLEPGPTLAAEERDPKHRILLSSSLLPHDLDVYRQHCENRRRPLAVAFADMDDFKSFNETLGEVEVDRYVLPSILSAVEGASYGHGRAYRFGGDEFVLLLPNADEHVAASLLREVKAAVEALRFERLDARARMSVGVWITVPDSHLTANELVNAASDAKRNSKALGKSRITIRTECGSVYRETFAE